MALKVRSSYYPMENLKIDVDYVAKLARLKLTEEEKKEFSKQFEDILKYINKLKELDVTDVEPTFHAIEIKNVFREDEVKPSDMAEDILSNAPEREGSFFKVKKVIE